MMTKLGDQKMILGIPWLQDNNPTINWKQGTIELVDWSRSRGRSLNAMTQYIQAIRASNELSQEESIQEWMTTAGFVDPEDIWVRAKLLAKLDDERFMPGNLETQQEDEKTPPERDTSTHGLSEDERTPQRKKDVWVCAKQSASQRFTQEAEEDGKQKKFVVLQEYSEYKDVFKKKASERLPERREWDHKVKMLPGYIQPSDAPNVSPFFFVEKKTKGEL